MNLYKFHPDPENAPYREWAYENVPALIWERYSDEPEELKKRERVLAKDAYYAYWYARDVLKGSFPAAEDTIANSHYVVAYYQLLKVRSLARAREFLVRYRPGDYGL